MLHLHQPLGHHRLCTASPARAVLASDSTPRRKPWNRFGGGHAGHVTRETRGKRRRAGICSLSARSLRRNAAGGVVVVKWRYCCCEGAADSLSVKQMSDSKGRARWAQLQERVSLRARIFSKLPLATAPYRPRLSTPDQPPHMWRLFHRQADALQLARSAAPAQEVHTFAFERPNQAPTGTRAFLVTSYSEFWHYYHVYCSGRASHQAHYYEVIPEGSTCHLYFDVEFSRESNPDLDGGSLTATLIKYVCACIQACYGLACTTGDVLSLDSSSASKFSRHLLFHIPGAAFQDNLQAGNFVRKIFKPLAEKICNIKLQGVPEAHSVCPTESPAVPHIAESTLSQMLQGEFKIKEPLDILESHKTLWDDADSNDSWIENWKREFDLESSRCGSENDQESKSNGECTGTLHDHTNTQFTKAGEMTLDCSETWYYPQDQGTSGPEKRSLWDILDYRATWQHFLEALIVKDKTGQLTLAVDLGVYTKNRNFRLYGSSKAGVLVPLRLAPDDSYVAQRLPAWGIHRARETMPSTGTTRASERPACSSEAKKHVRLQEKIFLASLITNVERAPGLRLLSCLGSPMDTHRTNTFAANNAHGDAKLVTGYQASPFPEIDAYIRSQLNKGGVQGDIRCWKFYEGTGLLVYEATKNRWCENVGRAHRSNNTCYFVDLHQGIFYQKCHDQECKAIHFRSQNYPLPQECLPKLILSRSDRFDNFPGEAGDKDVVGEGNTQNQTDTATTTVEDTHVGMST
uniref:DNA-directed primase/polymerase protein n=1 Tax=Petromyzon marinus TaxID=7757 RepID=A0AAJ7X0C8_PETMA|nr:DNA-directed primase/polymerase protein isoform X4 [Petromyzon marinus]